MYTPAHVYISTIHTPACTPIRTPSIYTCICDCVYTHMPIYTHALPQRAFTPIFTHGVHLYTHMYMGVHLYIHMVYTDTYTYIVYGCTPICTHVCIAYVCTPRHTHACILYVYIYTSIFHCVPIYAHLHILCKEDLLIQRDISVRDSTFSIHVFMCTHTHTHTPCKRMPLNPRGRLCERHHLSLRTLILPRCRVCCCMCVCVCACVCVCVYVRGST